MYVSEFTQEILVFLTRPNQWVPMKIVHQKTEFRIKKQNGGKQNGGHFASHVEKNDEHVLEFCQIRDDLSQSVSKTKLSHFKLSAEVVTIPHNQHKVCTSKLMEDFQKISMIMQDVGKSFASRFGDEQRGFENFDLNIDVTTTAEGQPETKQS